MFTTTTIQKIIKKKKRSTKLPIKNRKVASQHLIAVRKSIILRSKYNIERDQRKELSWQYIKDAETSWTEQRAIKKINRNSRHHTGVNRTRAQKKNAPQHQSEFVYQSHKRWQKTYRSITPQVPQSTVPPMILQKATNRLRINRGQTHRNERREVRG